MSTTPMAPTLVARALDLYTQTAAVREVEVAYDLTLRCRLFEQRLRSRLQLDPVSTVITARQISGRLETSADRNLRPEFVVLTVATIAMPDPLTPLAAPGLVDPLDVVEIVHTIGRTPAENLVTFALYTDTGGVPFLSSEFRTLIDLGAILATGWLRLVPAAPPLL